jgi:hypothetical protein
VLSGANILVDQNTGTEGTPVWANRLTIAVATGNITAPGTLAVTGTLGVTGAATLSSTLAVTGAISRAGVAIQPNVSYLAYADLKTLGSEGGTFTAGDWVTRVINTEISDPDSLGALPGSNWITLPAGTYECNVRAPAHAVGLHKLRLYDVVGAAAIANGENAEARVATLAQTCATVRRRFTLATEKYVAIQHQCQTTRATDGLGRATSFTDTEEIYTFAEFWKVA